MIRIDKYGLESDAHCWKLGEWFEAEAEDGTTELRLRNVTYPTTIESAMRSLLQRRIRDADAETISDLLAEVRDFRADVASRFTIRVEAA